MYTDCSSVVPQEHSRAPLDITLSGLDSLFGALKPFPSVSKIITAFSTSGSDSYLGRNAAHFVPHVEPTSTPQSEQSAILSCRRALTRLS